MPKVLTPEQQRHYRTAGYAFAIRVLSAAEADLYRTECDRLETLLGGRPRTVEVRQMHLHFPWAYRLAAHPRVLDAVEDLLGPNLLIWATELFAKPPRDSAVSIAWHRDGAYMGLDAERTVTAWIALTRSGPANGGMRVVQESNRLGYLQSDGDDKSRLGKPLSSPAEDKIVDVALQAGEMSLHDVHVLHGSGANQSGDKRVGFAVRFTTPETKPAVDRPPALLVRGEDRWGHFELVDPPSEDDPERALSGLRASARRHLDATLQKSEAGRPLMPAMKLYREGAAVNSIEETIRGYIRESFLDEGQVAELRSDEDLLMILDSLQILRMLIDLESKYSIKVDNSELTPENLGTVERVAAFIAKKCRESVC